MDATDPSLLREQKNEITAHLIFAKLAAKTPAGKSADILKRMSDDEQTHELLLIDMIDEEKLNYMGSVVLGLNDALVELTGALAGFTFAFQNTRIIAMTGLITGISASFSMAASEYLSTRQEKGEKGEAIKAAIYTGVAYVFTVAVLILPYFLFKNPFVCLGVSLFLAVAVIFVFNYYISVVKETPFRRRFLEMAAISLGVSGISFLIGMLVKSIFGIEG